jgi:vacuolar-type H+-ATPase subunit E/Vma4
MPTNIESFVKTLETEGIDAGKKAAQKIEAHAKQQAETIISEGKAKAEQIINQANTEAEKIKSRMNSSLELASRDAVFMLREKLCQQLKSLLQLNVEKSLSNPEILANILREVIPAYTKADAAGKQTTEINISANLKDTLLNSALQELKNAIAKQNTDIDVKYNLEKAGFEYKVEGSTVEISTESVTSLLSEMIDPDLQQYLTKAVQKGK